MATTRSFRRKDLGIVTTNDFKVSRQCAEAAAKANRVLGIVRRNFGNLDKERFLIIYKGFIRSHMVYAIRILRRTLIIWKRFREGQRN